MLLSAVKSLRRPALIVAIIGGLALVLIIVNRQHSSDKFTIGVIEPMQHIAVSDVTRGIKDALAPQSSRFAILVQNANGEKTAIPQIIGRLQDKGTSLFVPIFTGTTQITKSSVRDRPIVFAAVTDPVAAGIISDPNHPGGMITGVSDLWPVGAQLDLIRRILPTARVIGITYDPGDPSAAATLPVLKKEADGKGFSLELRPIHSANELPQALASLVGKIDLLFTANDVTVTAAFPALVAFSVTNKIPLFAGDYSSVQRGAIGAVGQNYHNVGIETASIIQRVADGEPVGSMPITFTSGGDVYLNVGAAAQMGVNIPDSVIKSAKQVYSTISEDGRG